MLDRSILVSLLIKFFRILHERLVSLLPKISISNHISFVKRKSIMENIPLTQEIN